MGIMPDKQHAGTRMVDLSELSKRIETLEKMNRDDSILHCEHIEVLHRCIRDLNHAVDCLRSDLRTEIFKREHCADTAAKRNFMAHNGPDGKFSHYLPMIKPTGE